jgi:hypothetical protein
MGFSPEKKNLFESNKLIQKVRVVKKSAGFVSHNSP